eukprot:TRINITY_DN18077_c0_g1_i2.p1 TRINITY_DN18077_c0_g1~~TRINITY_DN18077_c0_g1_i2.p1  ORF type:complete len:281 (+),score=89.14 TRINITY_DN18077_c0_g1_i2:37-879(+)
MGDARLFPAFDIRDQAPEDVHVDAGQCRGPLDPRAPLVRGSFRIEGVNFARYEALKPDPDRQRAFTSAIRDDLISEAGGGVVREDILLRLSPGPIKTVVLDYTAPPQEDGQPGLPSLLDAEWCIDCEYAIAAQNAKRQLVVAETLYDALASGDIVMEATKRAYIKYIHPDVAVAEFIKVVPTSNAPDGTAHLTDAHAPPAAPPAPRCPGYGADGLYSEDDPLEGRLTWHHRRGLPDGVPPCPYPSRGAPAVGGMPLEHRPQPDPAMAVSPTYTQQQYRNR